MDHSTLNLQVKTSEIFRSMNSVLIFEFLSIFLVPMKKSGGRGSRINSIEGYKNCQFFLEKTLFWKDSGLQQVLASFTNRSCDCSRNRPSLENFVIIIC